MEVYIDMAGMLQFHASESGRELLAVVKEFDPEFGISRGYLFPDPVDSLQPDQVLLTDMPDSAGQWRSAGGVGILLTRTDGAAEYVLARLLRLKRKLISSRPNVHASQPVQ